MSPTRRRTWPLLPLAAMAAGCGSGSIALDGDGYLYDWSLPEDHDPIPYGFWGLNGFQDHAGLADVEERFGMTVFHTSTRHPNYAVNDLLPLVREEGLQVNLRLVGDHSFYTDDDGNFDLQAWKDMLAPWEDSGVQEFIDDGTLANHMMLDDVHTFEGRSPTGDELEEMARTSKELLPGLRVIVREEAAVLPEPSSGTFEHVDAAVNQYRADDGDVELYAALRADAAERMGLEIINGLNIANGGDGSSGQTGWEADRWAMSADEIYEYGYVLMGVPGCTMFLNWEYDGEELWADGSVGADYFDQPEMAEALGWLGAYAAGEAD